MFYSTQHAHTFEAPDLEQAEARARIAVAQQGSLTKLLCVRESGVQGPTLDVPDPERRAKIKRIKAPEW
jgi:hypothetical protein